MPARITNHQISTTMQRLLAAEGLVDQDDSAVIFHDLSFMEAKVYELTRLFPAQTLHAAAIKSNPLRRILEKLNALGMGAEAATLPELHLARRAGFPPQRIVFDSPTKTHAEIEFALSLGAHINADSLSDLQRIDLALGDRQPAGSIGVRINPQVGTGKILSTSTAGDYSKFGVPIREFRQELIDSFLKFPWLRGVHLHIGSQGIALDQLLNGIGTVMDFVEEVNDRLKRAGKGRQIDIIDIGGGLPVPYLPGPEPIPLEVYAGELRRRHPGLFEPGMRLVTEFGRSIHANAGWVASRVENVKPGPQVDTAMIHVGADLFIRECYNPDDWKHEITVLDPTGKIKSGGRERKYMVAGPLCFAGDLVARDIILPEINQGDHIIIHDTGAYTLSMWSRYNSRQVPKVVGYYQDGLAFEILKERESIEQVLSFWA